MGREWLAFCAVVLVLSASCSRVVFRSDEGSYGDALGDNVGVGDVLAYDSDGNGSVDALAFIHGRTTARSFTVRAEDGSQPLAAIATTA